VQSICRGSCSCPRLWAGYAGQWLKGRKVNWFLGGVWVDWEHTWATVFCVTLFQAYWIWKNSLTKATDCSRCDSFFQKCMHSFSTIWANFFPRTGAALPGLI
jgi:hypothetical protein